VFGRRAALAALDEAPPHPRSSPPVPTPIAQPDRSTREAMDRCVGIERTPEGLRAMLDDPHPLARLVAASALHREETRGAHRRADFPDRDAALDGVHGVVPPRGAETFERWD
jgi:L-aspartate oxidase